jgi:hypothetical protein
VWRLYILFLRNVRRLLVTANVVPISPILVTSQKTAFFIVTAMKTSNPTHEIFVLSKNIVFFWGNVKHIIVEECRLLLCYTV